MRGCRLLLIGVVLATSACQFVKVPIVDVNARFELADASWFEEEQTLFVFWHVNAEQGLGPASQIELSFRTDDAFVDWTPIQNFTQVHTHVPVDCGVNAMCGSTSLHVVKPPREVKLQLRYHRDGEMTLPASVTYNIVQAGAPQTNRSAIVYGVFDETNTHVQWRLRHQFPTIRNEDAQGLGLRRHFEIADQVHGSMAAAIDGNPYGYGYAGSCEPSFTSLGWPKLETSDRAIFEETEVPISAYPSTTFCARSTVTDALGTFDAVALARKNPEVAPAFPALRSPIQTDRMVSFFLRMCGKTISEDHRAMQVQRLQLESSPEICIDTWQSQGFADSLASQFRTRIDAERTQGVDMILTFSVHHDDETGQLAAVIEQALEQILPFEANKSSPRVVGAFVYDSFTHTVATPDLQRLVMWCPPTLGGADLEKQDPTQGRRCPPQADQPDLKVGPIKLNQAPTFPTREQYLTFIGKYGVAQAGKIKSLTFRAPTRTPLSTNIPVGDFGVATFFNNEVLTANATDKFSWCAPEDQSTNLIVFRVPALSPDPVPISALPELQAQLPQGNYPLGLLWDFPYLMRFDWEVVLAGAATAYSFTVPFGIATTDTQYYTAKQWEQSEFPLGDALLRCTRFCDHPTFDSDKVYNVSSPFDPTFRQQCYRAKFPKLGDDGFPHDP